MIFDIMARSLRIHYPGAFYHVMMRGNARHDIFFNDDDRMNFCSLLAEGVERFKHRIHAYCLMDNHVHLIVQAGEKPIGKAIQNVSFRHAQRLNIRSDSIGHRFQGRYRAILVEEDAYLQSLAKYIHLNPVRAKMVKYPHEYWWSSHNDYCGSDEFSWIEKDFVLGTYDVRREIAVQLYLDSLEIGIPTNILDRIINPKCNGSIIGSDDFIEKINSELEADIYNQHICNITVEDVIRVVCNHFDIDHIDIVFLRRNRLIRKIRSIIAYVVLNTEHLTFRTLAQRFNTSISYCSKIAKELENKLAQDEELAFMVDGLFDELLWGHTPRS